MKIILEDIDREYIKKINKGLVSDDPIPVFCGEKRNYSISFDVVDIAKANAFVMGIVMAPHEEHAKEIEDLIGIRFTSINFSVGDTKLKELKSMLKQFLIDLERV